MSRRRTSPPAASAAIGLADIPEGPLLEDILGRLSIQERATVARTGRAMRSAVSRMSEYPFKEEYARLTDLFRGLRGTVRVVADIPARRSGEAAQALAALAAANPGAWRALPALPEGARIASLVLTADYDLGGGWTRKGERLDLYISLDAVVCRPGYPAVFGAIDVEDAPANPVAADAHPVFGQYYRRDEPSNPEQARGAGGLTAPEAFIDGARLMGSLRELGVVVYTTEGLSEVADGLMIPLLNKCGVPTQNIRLSHREKEARLGYIAGETKGYLRVVMEDAMEDQHIIAELQMDGIPIDWSRIPKEVRYTATGRQGYSLVLEVDVPPPEVDVDGFVRLVLERTRGSRSRSKPRPIELWKDTDVENMEHYARVAITRMIGRVPWNRKGVISIEGQGDIARGALAYAIRVATQDQRHMFGKNYADYKPTKTNSNSE